MKKRLIAALTLIAVCAAFLFTGCAPQGQQPSATEPPQATADSAPAATGTVDFTAANDAVRTALEKLEAAHYSGVVYAEKDGKPVAVYADGKLSGGVPITIDTPMPIGSVSKQFCAAAVMLLQEQGKLSVNDTLGTYYPAYEAGKDITLHQMLANRSGIPNLDENTPLDEVTFDKTDEENTATLTEWLFAQPLLFEPDEKFSYSNFNFFLLSNIVEKVSGKRYIDFLRESFFTPLGMEHTGSVDELEASPEWAKGFSYEKPDFVPAGIMPGLCKGAGDIIATAADMTAWMNALRTGKSVSAESYKAMTTDYSQESDHYGYGLYVSFGGGVGHFGLTGHFTAADCINEKENLTIFMASNKGGQSAIVDRFGFLSIALRDKGEKE